MPKPVERGQVLTLDIADAAFEGKAVARVNGFVVFVEGAVPGDRVSARIVRVKRQFAEAVVLSVESPSPLRTEPRCEHFGVCGGCKWQNVSYAAQLRYKRQHVVDAFERIGNLHGIPTEETLPSPSEYFYRNKMEFSFGTKEWLVRANDSSARPGDEGRASVFVGLHVPQRYDKILNVNACHLQSDESNRILAFIRRYAREKGLTAYDEESGYLRFLVIRQSRRTSELMVNIVTFTDQPEQMQQLADALCAEIPEVTTIVNTINTKKAQIAYGDTEHIYYGPGVMHEMLGGIRFSISASSFFQTNTEQAERLYETALSFAGLSGSQTVYDLYSGTGAIALVAAQRAKVVVGIESVSSSVEDAKRNAAENDIHNCEFVLGDLRERLTKPDEWARGLPPPDVVILDPPRSGIHPDVVTSLLRIAAPRIVYVSCNPATQARDCALLADGYAVTRCAPVDMFPHTYHVENVALLERRREA